METISEKVLAGWDSYDAYLFDIDGTLLHCSDAVHYFAFCNALGWIAERPLDLGGVTTHGNTDVGILRDALRLARIPDDVWRPKLNQLRDRMCCFVEANKSDLRATSLPAVTSVLRYLRHKGRTLAVATGNLERIGVAKLRCAGLSDYFQTAGYSDAFEHRSDVFQSALEKVCLLAGERARVCVVGDTPEDIRAARANKLDIIAVATGTYTVDELRSFSPTWTLRSLEEAPLS